MHLSCCSSLTAWLFYMIWLIDLQAIALFYQSQDSRLQLWIYWNIVLIILGKSRFHHLWRRCGRWQFFEWMEGFLFQSSFNLLENQNQNLWLPKDFIVFRQQSWDRFFPSRPSAKTLSGPRFVSLRKNNEKTFSIFFFLNLLLSRFLARARAHLFSESLNSILTPNLTRCGTCNDHHDVD